jgi:hypothetical protein
MRRREFIAGLGSAAAWSNWDSFGPIGRQIMKLPRRAFLQFAGAAATAPVFSRVAKAQVYPSRPITLIVSAAAGGPSDVVG